MGSLIEAMLTYQNERLDGPNGYNQLVEGLNGTPVLSIKRSSFAHLLADAFEIDQNQKGKAAKKAAENSSRLENYFIDKLSGRKLIDIAYLERESDHRSILASHASQFGASHYLMFTPAASRYGTAISSAEKAALSPLQMDRFEGNLLLTLAKMQSTANIATFSLDCALGNYANRYMDAVTEEISRLTERGNIVFGSHSELFHSLNHKNNKPYFNRVQYPGLDAKTYRNITEANKVLWIFERK